MTNNPTAVIFMGIQGSGKTTYYGQAFAENYVHISLDSLKTRTKERLLVIECINGRKIFVVDNTNPTKADRARYIPLAKAAGYRIEGYFFQSRLKDCISRNNQRTGKARIPAIGIVATSNKLEMPAWEEGFDALYFVVLSGECDPQTGNSKMIKSEWRAKR